MNWGTYPQHLPFDANPNRTIAAAEKMLVDRGLAKTGDHLVIFSDMQTGDHLGIFSDVQAGEHSFDSIQLRIVP